MTSRIRKNALKIGAVLATLALAGTSLGALLGIVPGFELISYTSSSDTSTQISGGVLTVNSTPQALLLSPISFPIIIGPVGGSPPTLTMGVGVSGACALTGGVSGDDLVITGTVDLGGGDVRSGVLLTAEVLGFGFLDAGATDVYDFRFDVTGGLLSDLYTNEDLGVTLNSENSSFAGDCSVDSSGRSKGTIGAIPPILPAEGCTPGYWKQAHHFDSWVDYLPTQTVASVFGPLDASVDGLTLEQALKQGGGGLKALMRHAVAALLNAASGDVNAVAFPTPADVIAATQAAVNGGDIEATKNAFEAANETGCPLN